MTEIQARKIFEKYNPAADVMRCPNGRAKMRKPLDLYAKAAVNLYGIIKLDEFAGIFNKQNREQTTADEVYTILLPNVLKYRWYGFYKDYLVHYIALSDFSWVENLEQHQAGKPRYLPPKEKFLMFENEYYEDDDHWKTLFRFMTDSFNYNVQTVKGFNEIKNSVTQKHSLTEFGAIMDKYNLVFKDQKQAQEFLDLLVCAKNNDRIWENKGHSPEELMKMQTSKQSRENTEPVINQHKKPGPNHPCPCGSGKKFKKCCALVGMSGRAQLSPDERKLFYETFYKLLDFVNQKYKIFNFRIKPVYPAYHDETQLHKIREKLWKNPKVISEFLAVFSGSLSGEEIRLLQSWEKNHVKGSFILMKYEPDCAVFMRMEESFQQTLYAVKGMTTSIAEAMNRRLPVMLDTVLLPFKDKIIYDSYIATREVGFGDGIRKMLEDEFNAAEKQYGITARFSQGSR